MQRLLLSVLAAGTLAACTPMPPACRVPADVAREIRTVDRLIAETETNIARGYAMGQVQPSAGVNLCLGGESDNVGLSFCTDGRQSRPVAIDRAAETRKLEGLRNQRALLEKRGAASVAACRGAAS